MVIYLVIIGMIAIPSLLAWFFTKPAIGDPDGQIWPGYDVD